MPQDRTAASLPPPSPAAAHGVNPTLAFAALGAASGLAGTFGLGIAIGEAPAPGIYMIPAGLWFGLVVALAVWKLGHASPGGTAVAFLATFIAWEASVNLALVMIDPWLKAGPSDLVFGMVGVAAGALGALLTWAGAARAAPILRCFPSAILTIAAGAAFGALLGTTNSFDSPALLFIPWEAAVAAALASGLTRAPA